MPAISSGPACGDVDAADRPTRLVLAGLAGEDDRDDGGGLAPVVGDVVGRVVEPGVVEVIGAVVRGAAGAVACGAVVVVEGGGEDPGSPAVAPGLTAPAAARTEVGVAVRAVWNAPVAVAPVMPAPTPTAMAMTTAWRLILTPLRHWSPWVRCAAGPQDLVPRVLV